MDEHQVNRMIIAAHALSGLMANPQAPNDMAQIARAAVAAADALFKELAKEPED